MPTYQIEMLWTCRICRSADNRGLHKHCTNCGKPKDERDAERFPDDISEANALSGDGVKKALAGPDWKCKYCEALQNSLGRCCSECGCDRETGAKPWETEELSVSQNVETGRKSPVRKRHVKMEVDPSIFQAASTPRPADPTPTPTTFESEVRDFVPDTGGYRTPPKIFIPKMPLHRRPGVRRAAAVSAIAVFVALTLWLIFRTKVVDAKVTAVSWQHDVLVDRYQVYRKEGWEAEPGSFDVHDEGRRVHHYDHVKVGSHKEQYEETYDCGRTCKTIKGTCRTTPRNCKSNKNGTATCTGGDRVCDPDTESCATKTCKRPAYRTVDDYEDQPRYRTWYSWKVWEWGYDRTVRASGTSMETRWPSDAEVKPPYPLAASEQERTRRQESYSVTFSDKKDSWTIRPKTESDFQRFPPGKRFKLKVGIANGVTVLGSDGSSDSY